MTGWIREVYRDSNNAAKKTWIMVPVFWRLWLLAETWNVKEQELRERIRAAGLRHLCWRLYWGKWPAATKDEPRKGTNGARK